MKLAKCEACNGTGKQIDQKALGAKMKKLRVTARISLRTLAKIMELSPPYISDLERGNRKWNTNLIERYEAACRP